MTILCPECGKLVFPMMECDECGVETNEE